MSPAIRSKGLAARSLRFYLQLGIAILGTVVIIWGVFGLATSVSLSKSDSGFVEGLAIIFYGVYVLGGFVVLAAGLLVPQRDDSGIRFSARQRKLLAYGVVAPIVSVLVIPIGATVSPPLTEPVIDIFVAVVAALVLSGPLATMTAIGLKLHSHRQ